MVYPKLKQSSKIEGAYEEISAFIPGPKIPDLVLEKAGMQQKEIANEIGGDPSTVSRKLKRNQGLRGYRPSQAHDKVLKRKKRYDSKDSRGQIKNRISSDESPEIVERKGRLILLSVAIIKGALLTMLERLSQFTTCGMNC